MAQAVKIITPPEIEPVTVDDVKKHARISHDVEDALLAHWIRTGRELAESYQRRSYITQTLEVAFDLFPELPFNLPRGPLVSVQSVKYYDYQNTEVTIPLDTFIVDTDSEPGRLCFGYSKVWPAATLRPYSSLKIRYVAGYGDSRDDVPADVKDAIMLYCSFRNENRSGEYGEVPECFYNLLYPTRLYI